MHHTRNKNKNNSLSFRRYILVYPQGCDVANHLSLFLCVADYDKLLPGWSHFAQFTIAVVNKDPKKSKYSDTLHRFCKKEHDWGWKKFMELSKVADGFVSAPSTPGAAVKDGNGNGGSSSSADGGGGASTSGASTASTSGGGGALVIKAQVQVIRDRPAAPFRCLDAQYRRELVRVYLTNVEALARKHADDARAALGRLASSGPGFAEWWRRLPEDRRKKLANARADAVLKGLVKRFFNEKEVTSTLVMDALCAGCGASAIRLRAQFSAHDVAVWPSALQN